MLGIKPKSPLNDSYTSPPATHVSNAAAINNAVNQITAAIRAKGAKTDEEKDQAREDKLMNKQIRNRRKLNRLEGKVDNVGDKRKERIKETNASIQRVDAQTKIKGKKIIRSKSPFINELERIFKR